MKQALKSVPVLKKIKWNKLKKQQRSYWAEYFDVSAWFSTDLGYRLHAFIIKYLVQHIYRTIQQHVSSRSWNIAKHAKVFRIHLGHSMPTHLNFESLYLCNERELWPKCILNTFACFAIFQLRDDTFGSFHANSPKFRIAVSL